MKHNFSKPAPAYMAEAIQWVDSLTYPEITEQIVIYHGYIKTYEDSYSNIIAFIPLVLTIVQLSDADTLISQSIVFMLAILGLLIAIIMIIIAFINRSLNLGYLAVSLPIVVGIQFITQDPKVVILLAFIMVAIYFYILAHYKPKDMKDHIILELLKQRKALIESSNPASEIRLPKTYKNNNHQKA